MKIQVNDTNLLQKLFEDIDYFGNLYIRIHIDNSLTINDIRFKNLLYDKFLKYFKIENVNGDVEFSGFISILPKLKKVTGNYSCSNTDIKSLENTPRYVGKSFSCSYTSISNFKGLPEFIGSNIQCNHVYTLTSLQGLPESVNGYLSLDDNDLTSLEYFPKFIRSNCSLEHNKLTTLDGIGVIQFSLDIRDNDITLEYLKKFRKSNPDHPKTIYSDHGTI